MRIALLSTQFPGVRLGGIGAYTRHCAAALARVGHEPHLFTLPIPPDLRAAVPAGVVLHEIPDPARANALPNALPMGDRLRYEMALGFAPAVLQAHARKPFDIVEGPEYEALGLDLIAVQALPMVTQMHSGTALSRLIDGTQPDQQQALRESRELEAMAAADAICAPSFAVIRDTRRAYGITNLAEHARVIPLPFDPPEIPFTLPAEHAPLLYVGRLEYLKGAHLLAEAAVTFLTQYPAARLRIVGPDTLTAPNEHGKPGGTSMAKWMKVKLAPVADRAQFVGELPSAGVRHEMQQCAYVIIPSLAESYSYVCCEALAAGRLVIVSSDIGTIEVAGSAGVSFARGYSADSARAMSAMREDAKRREELSRAAWKRAREELSSAVTMPKRIAFYEQVIAARARGGAAASGDVEERLLSLPESHAFRLNVARALARGEADLLPAFMPQADLPTASATPGDRLMARLGSLGRAVRFYFYGAGRHTARLLLEQARWEAAGHRLVGLIDDHPRYAAAEGEVPTAHGLGVMSCAAALEKVGADDVVVLSTDAFEEQFWGNTERLRGRGVVVVRLYTA